MFFFVFVAKGGRPGRGHPDHHHHHPCVVLEGLCLDAPPKKKLGGEGRTLGASRWVLRFGRPSTGQSLGLAEFS